MLRFFSNISNNLQTRFLNTPYKRDRTAIIAGLFAFTLLCYFWPLISFNLLAIVVPALIINNLVAFYLRGVNLWKCFKDSFTRDASYKLMKLAEDNTLTVDKAEWLLQQGIFRDKADFNGGVTPQPPFSPTVLHWAAHHGRKDLVQLFLAKGADPLAQASLIGTPFHVAVTRNHLQLLPFLFIDRQQLSDAKCGNLGCKPIAYAALKGNTQLFQYLDKQLNAFESEEDTLSVLAGAVRGDHVDILKSYVQNHGNVFKDAGLFDMNKNGNNLIHVAARFNSPLCLIYLLENANPVDYNLLNNEGATPRDEAFINSSNAALAIFNTMPHRYGNAMCLTKLYEQRDVIKESKQHAATLLKNLKPTTKGTDFKGASKPYCGEEAQSSFQRPSPN
ncbi:MAG: ankyrin repeat domain-containing protein [Proteobacteria bacterium]|nr:ankyrin repeat domain-containing protein [Pseudomonadota bacterium]